MLRQIGNATVLVARGAQFADRVGATDARGNAHQQRRLVRQFGLAGVQEEVLHGRAGHAVPLRGDHHQRVGGGQLLLVFGPGALVVGRPQRQAALAEVEQAALLMAGQTQLDQALAEEAGDLGGLAAAAAGAGDQGDIEHGGDSWRMTARRLPTALERGKWRGDRDLVG